MADDASKNSKPSAPSLPDPAATTAEAASDSSQTPAGPDAEPSIAPASPPAANASIPASSAAAAASVALSSSDKAADVDPASEPAIPERNYPKDARLLQYSPPSQAIPSSRALPRFLKVLAAVIFVTGTTASICALLYQRYVLPKLLVTKARLASLHQHNLFNYDKLLVSIHGLLQGSNSLYSGTLRKLALRRTLADPTLPAKAQETIAASTGNEARPLQDSEQKEREPKPDQEQDQVLPGLTDELRASLDKLSTTLTAYAPTQESPSWDKLTKSEEPSPGQSLIKSLETLTNFLTNESFYASTPSYPSSAYGYNYGGAAQMPTRSGTDREKIQQVKGEIRSLKGALLTRKNFAPVKDVA